MDAHKVIEEYLNNKVISLVKQMLSCEEEKKSLLLELVTMENTANNSRSDRNLGDVCKNLKLIVENLVVTVQDNDRGETCESETETIPRRKCRYFNRGYCKYKENCKYSHASKICEEYLKDGICVLDRCADRHPKHCRYWSSDPEGCRYKSCQYLHVSSEKCQTDNQDVSDNCDDWERNYASTNDARVNMITTHEGSVDSVSCDQRDNSHGNKNCLENHGSKVNELNGFASNKDFAKIIMEYESHEPDENYIPSMEDIEKICRRYEDDHGL